ncbi:Hypothetical protein HVR_LOCUS906 [uncultured virus]|nr:Hypothetical protein HVR_LOCUS906 [uncultured virus]
MAQKVINEPVYDEDIQAAVNYVLRQANKRRGAASDFSNQTGPNKAIIDTFEKNGVFKVLKGDNILDFYERYRCAENYLRVKETNSNEDQIGLTTYDPISCVYEDSWTPLPLNLIFGEIALMPTYLSNCKQCRKYSGGCDVDREFGCEVNRRACNKKMVKSRVNPAYLEFGSPYEMQIYSETTVLSFTTNHPFITACIKINDPDIFLKLSGEIPKFDSEDIHQIVKGPCYPGGKGAFYFPSDEKESSFSFGVKQSKTPAIYIRPEHVLFRNYKNINFYYTTNIPPEFENLDLPRECSHIIGVSVSVAKGTPWQSRYQTLIKSAKQGQDE